MPGSRRSNFSAAGYEMGYPQSHGSPIEVTPGNGYPYPGHAISSALRKIHGAMPGGDQLGPDEHAAVRHVVMVPTRRASHRGRDCPPTKPASPANSDRRRRLLHLLRPNPHPSDCGCQPPHDPLLRGGGDGRNATHAVASKFTGTSSQPRRRRSARSSEGREAIGVQGCSGIVTTVRMVRRRLGGIGLRVCRASVPSQPIR